MLAHWLGGGTGGRADVTWSPLDPRWYSEVGLESDAGVLVTPETILRCGTVLAALRFLADTVSMCPFHVYRRVGENRREQADDHYLARVMRRPNLHQTGYRWRHLQMAHLGGWGNAYNRIVNFGRPDMELRALHPSRVRLLDELADGSLLYGYTPPGGGQEQKLSQDQVLHFRGLSIDGKQGVKTYQLIRQAVGIALAAERHAAVFLKKGTRLSGLLSTEQPLGDEVRKKAEESWNAAFGGSENEGKTALVAGGLKFTPVSTDHRNAQYMELRDFQVGEILRFLGVPGVVVGWAEKTATYASAEAFFEKGGIKHCILPWIENIEDEIDNALILDADPHYVKAQMAVLLRPSPKDQADILQKEILSGYTSRNEARAILDRNPGPAELDEFLEPMNMQTAGDDPEPVPPPRRRPPPPPEEDDDEDAAAARAAVFVLDAATRLVRKEVAAATAAALKTARNRAQWAEMVTTFYEGHAALVADTMHVSAAAARAYCDTQRELLIAQGVEAARDWMATLPAQLAALFEQEAAA